MRISQVPLVTISCESAACNRIEVELWKKRFLEKQAIPSPWLNAKLEVVAFHSCFHAIKELGLREVSAVIVE